MTTPRRALIAATTALATAFAGTHIAHAEPALGTGVELGTTMDKTVAVDTTVNLGASRTEGIPALKRLRAKMWDENPPFVGTNGWGEEVYTTNLRAAAAKNGLNSKEEYVNAVYSDAAMVAIAVQRAMEESTTSDRMDHQRPTNTQCGNTCGSIWGATFAGKSSSAENLAWNFENSTLDEMIYDQWGMGEYEALVNLGGRSGKWGNKSSGHLWSLINPELTGYGFGFVNANTDKAYPVAGATAATANGSGKDDSLEDRTQTITLYRATYDGETPTGVQPIEVLEGQGIKIEHTATLWGGGGEVIVMADQVDQDTLKTVTVEGRLPSGEMWEEVRTYLVKNSMRDQFALSYPQGKAVREGASIEFPLTTSAPLPAGTTFTAPEGASVSNDGTVTWQAPEVDADAERTLRVGVKYPDGSVGNVDIVVTVNNSMRDKYAPAAPTTTYDVVEGQTVAIDLSDALSGLPAGTRISGATDNVLHYTGQAVSADTTVTVPATVVYPDESTDTIELSVLVKDKLADQYNPTFPANTTANENTTATITPATPLADLPAGTTVGLGKEIPGVTMDTNGVITYVVGELNGSRTETIPVVYTFTDGSTKTVNVPVALNDLTPPEEGSSTGAIIGIVIAVLAVVGGAIAAFMSGAIKL